MSNPIENDTIKAMAGAKLMLRHLLLNQAPETRLPLGLLSQVIELESSLEDALQIKLPGANAEDFEAIGHLGIEEVLPD